MSHYTNIPSASGPQSAAGWGNLTLTQETVAKRNSLKSVMDEFTGFSWRGVDSFATFGAFIINNKNLKFYSGPSFSNEYSKPQFSSSVGQLTGITFQVQKIDFQIGVYWISEEHFRWLINWLNPYEINALSFNFEPDYYYQVKLASVENGTRYVVGKEADGYRYYTEFKLTFEVQGEQCAYFKQYYQWDETIEDGQHVFTVSSYTPWSSDLKTPFQIQMEIPLESITEWPTNGFLLIGDVQYENQALVTLFSVVLKNLTNVSTLNLLYDSENGQLFREVGGNMELITRLSTSTTGKRIVGSMNVNPFFIPGRLNDWDFDLSKFKILLKLKDSDRDINYDLETNIICRARTNLI